MEKIKTVEEYQQLASRTCPDLGSNELNLRHMQMGVITEVGETLDVIKKFIAYGKPLDIVNIGEEIADTIWYKANEARMAGVVWKQEEFDTYLAEFDTAIINNGEYSVTEETIDTLIVSVLPITYSIDEGLVNIRDVASLCKAAEFYSLDFFQILTNNINKLKIRYPEKFTNEAALNRDTTAERVELEK